MSRAATPPPGAWTSQPKVPHDKIAARAYEKWCQRGRPPGTDLQDWLEAERELLTEAARPGLGAVSPRR